ncbi:inner membrane protein YiaA [Comamonas sp. GB3 AK4-5]|uniref:inner membrane protein YiaA n=1 Tax=Comamonas sp. GB3 AK4-5 TaxID=3231487 RepID=UPI00351EE56B
MEKPQVQQPSAAFVGASWAALLLGGAAYMVGLWNAGMALNEKGYYFAVLVLGLYAAISLQKVVRDRIEDIPVTGIYYGISWVALLIGVGLLAVGLFNATLALSEKGFYAMAFLLALFGAIAVQKNTRDIQAHHGEKPKSAQSKTERSTEGDAGVTQGQRVLASVDGAGSKPVRDSQN